MAKALSFSPNSAKKVATKYGYTLSRVRSSVIFLRNPCQSPLAKLSRINFAASGSPLAVNVKELPMRIPEIWIQFDVLFAQRFAFIIFSFKEKQLRIIEVSYR